MRNLKVYALFILGLLLLTLLPPELASAQIVMVDKCVKITKVDIERNRLEVGGTGQNDETTLYVLIDGYTKVTHDGKPMSWKQLRKGQLVRVQGGLTLEMRISAKKITLIQ